MVAADKTAPAPAPGPAQFEMTRRGYNQRQVDERISRMSTDLKAASRGRDEALASVAELSKALSYAQKELAEAKDGLARLTASPTGASAMAERVRMMMQLAEEEIAELRAKADEDAAATREEADKYSRDARRAAEQLAKERTAEHEQLLADGRAEIEKLNEAAAEDRRRLDAEAQARRDEADQKAAEELLARKSEAEAALEKHEAEVKARAANLLAEAEKKLADATEDRRLALDLRRRVTERISAAQSAVLEAVKQLGPAEPEEATSDPAQAKTPSPKPSPISSS